jgi:zinc/manganese transport system substrate-binding protein
MTRQVRLLLLTAVSATALLAAAGCGRGGGGGAPASPTSSGVAAPTTIPVVASTDVYASVARAIGGRHVSVTSIIQSPDADPHEYESTPADAAAVSTAKVLVENGGGYDDFADKILAATGAKPAVIDVSQLSGLNTGGEFNEHVFYHLPTVAKLGDALAGELGKADPGNAADYQANARAFHTQLDGLNAKVAAIKTARPGARVAVTEPVPLYLVEQAGLVDATPEAFSHAVEEGNDPPADVLRQTLALFTGPTKVSALLLNAQTESAATNQVQQAATANGVPVVRVTETLPAGTMDYVTWMGGQIDQLATAVGGRQ